MDGQKGNDDWVQEYEDFFNKNCFAVDFNEDGTFSDPYRDDGMDILPIEVNEARYEAAATKPGFLRQLIAVFRSSQFF